MDPLTLILGLGTSIIERLFPDPTQAAAAKLKLLELQQSGELAAMTSQTDTNKAEGASSSVFVAGWRPFIGWVCGAACAWNWIGLPIVKTLIVMVGYKLAVDQADLSQMLPILMGMLGLGGLRTIEKINGVASK
jgi:hypothetical protein